MRTRWRFGALIVTTGLLLAPATAGQALPNHGGRANDWVEVWCDTNTANADGDAITLSIATDGTTRGGADDVAAKVVDASAFDPGMKDSSHYNQVAGVVQGWFCGVLRYANGTIVNET